MTSEVATICTAIIWYGRFGKVWLLLYKLSISLKPSTLSIALLGFVHHCWRKMQDLAVVLAEVCGEKSIVLNTLTWGEKMKKMLLHELSWCTVMK
jgi:hypothetical protein